MWRSNLNGGAKRMLDDLVDAYPRAMSREELSEAAGISHTGGTWGTYLSKLKTNGLAEVEGGEIRASGTLFGV